MYNLYIMCVYVNYACVHYVIMYTSAYIICVCTGIYYSCVHRNILFVYAQKYIIYVAEASLGGAHARARDSVGEG